MCGTCNFPIAAAIRATFMQRMKPPKQYRSGWIDAPYFDVRIAPAVAQTVTVTMKRYVNDPTLAFPWDRGWWDDQAAPPLRRRGPP